MFEKFIKRFGYIKENQYRNRSKDPYNCSFDKCPKFNKEKWECQDVVPANEDCCWFLRWAEDNYKIINK